MNIIALAENLELAVDEIFGLMKLFYDNSLFDLRILQEAWTKGATHEVAEAAHSIKGGAINLGLQGIHKVAKEIELKARRNNLKEVKKALPLLQEKLDRLGQSILNRSMKIP